MLGINTIFNRTQRVNNVSEIAEPPQPRHLDDYAGEVVLAWTPRGLRFVSVIAVLPSPFVFDGHAPAALYVAYFDQGTDYLSPHDIVEGVQ